MLWVKVHNFVFIMGQSVEFGCALLAKAQDLIRCCKPERRIWLFAMGYNAEFGYAQWAAVKNLL
jgi:hypothetical protein